MEAEQPQSEDWQEQTWDETEIEQQSQQMPVQEASDLELSVNDLLEDPAWLFGVTLEADDEENQAYETIPSGDLTDP